jgi:hypothetical protein
MFVVQKTIIYFNSSYEEFLAQTQKPEFEKDSGWDGLDEQQIYTQDEYREFEMKRQEEIQRLIAQGVVSYCLLPMPVVMACLCMYPYSALCLLQFCRVKLSCYLCSVCKFVLPRSDSIEVVLVVPFLNHVTSHFTKSREKESMELYQANSLIDQFHACILFRA